MNVYQHNFNFMHAGDIFYERVKLVSEINVITLKTQCTVENAYIKSVNAPLVRCLIQKLTEETLPCGPAMLSRVF